MKEKLKKRLKEFEKRQENLKGNYTDKIYNLKRRINECDDIRRNHNIGTIIILIFFLIVFIIFAIVLYKEIKTPVLSYDEAIIYFNDGAKCLGFQTGTWKKDVKNARKVKIEYKGEKFWFYTDFDSAREFWNKYQK